MTALAAKLSALKHNLQTATQFLKPWDQFHDDVAMASIHAPVGVPAANPTLERIIAVVAEHLFKRHAAISDAHFFHVAEHHFWHGSCQVGGRVAIGFYFDDDDQIGLVGFMRSVHSSEVQLARLRPMEVPAGTHGGVAGTGRRN